MTMWDATLAELKTALARAGRRPLDDAHALTLAVDALTDLADLDETHVPLDAHGSEVAELEERISELEGEVDEAEKAQRAAERRVDDLEGDLLEAQQDLAAARVEVEQMCEALEGDEGAQAATIVRLADALASEREARRSDRQRVRELLQNWSQRCCNSATALERPRAPKVHAVRGLRALAEAMEFELRHSDDG